MEKILAQLFAEPKGWAFHQPVDTVEQADYLDIVKHPMGMSSLMPSSTLDLVDRRLLSTDFSTIERKVKSNQYKTFESFEDDVQLVFDNCRLYNPEHNIYAKNARHMDQLFKSLLAQHLKQEDR